MKVQHATHKSNEWFDVVDEDPDLDWETGEYVGFTDKLKLSDGKWYSKSECVYMNINGEIKRCCS